MSKCNDTTDGNTPPTLGETPKQSSSNVKRIGSKRPVSATSDFNAKSKEPPPRFLMNELHRLTFKVGDNAYRADDTEHTFAWVQFVEAWATLKNPVDWEDLEERARFLNTLYVWCEQNGQSFPLQEVLDKENFPEKI